MVCSVLFFVVASVLHPLLLYFGLQSVLEFGACAWTNVITNWIMAVFAVGYIVVCKPMEPGTWPSFQLRAALEPSQVLCFLRLALPGVLSMSEWWFWEATCFLAGKIGTLALAAHSIAYSLVPVLYMFPLGVAIPLAARVANLLGEDRPSAAWLFSRVGICIGTILSSFLAAVIWLTERWIIHLFTSDLEVIELCIRMWPWLTSFLVLDGLFCMQESLPRALGMQLHLGFVTIVSLWVVGIPAMYWVAISHGFGFVGIWYTLTPIFILYNVTIFATYCAADWAAVATQIQRDMEARVNLANMSENFV